jgi:hypothetical protein
MDPLTILAALGPLAVDLGKSMISRFVAPAEFKATKIEDYAKMKELELASFKAINEAGGTNQSYPWVEAIVRLMRPAVAIVVIGTWGYMEITAMATDSATNFASAIGFYLFGDRTLFIAKGGAK